jgi:hypothetical protein
MQTDCAGCGACEPDDDCGCTHVCDEGAYCDKHWKEEETIQAARLGISTSMTKEQRQAQLRAMAPIGICGTCCLVEEDCMCEPMPLEWMDTREEWS